MLRAPTIAILAVAQPPLCARRLSHQPPRHGAEQDRAKDPFQDGHCHARQAPTRDTPDGGRPFPGRDRRTERRSAGESTPVICADDSQHVPTQMGLTGDRSGQRRLPCRRLFSWLGPRGRCVLRHMRMRAPTGPCMTNRTRSGCRRVPVSCRMRLMCARVGLTRGAGQPVGV